VTNDDDARRLEAEAALIDGCNKVYRYLQAKGGYLEQRGWAPQPGSRAEGHTGIEALYLKHAGTYLSSSEDHLMATIELVKSGIRSSALQTLLRTSVEASARGYWLLENIPDTQRACRGATEQLEYLLAEQKLGPPQKTAIDTLCAEAVALGLHEKHSHPRGSGGKAKKGALLGWGDGPRKATDLVVSVFPKVGPHDVTAGAYFYALLSASTHGRSDLGAYHYRPLGSPDKSGGVVAELSLDAELLTELLKIGVVAHRYAWLRWVDDNGLGRETWLQIDPAF